jgi:proline iminopeptidase
VSETPFEVAVADGVLHGHRGGRGAPALLLHGGPAYPDYTEDLAAELDGLFETMRYTQRGTPPTTVGGPYTIESHMDDALAVLDHFECEQAWAVGHSWGGHLVLHLAVAHPERLLGIVCVDPLGAFREVFEEYGQNMTRRLTPEQKARIDEVEQLRREGRATEADLIERARLGWPQFFADPAHAPPLPANMRIGVECSRETNAAITDHFARRTLEQGLPGVRIPALFVHGELDPMPPGWTRRTAALVPGAAVVILPGRGHFPWMEMSGEIRDAVASFRDGG